MDKNTIDKIKQLQEQKQKIDTEIQQLYSQFYKKYENDKTLVKDDNPYSRLYALKKMGIVENFEEISQKTIIIVGVGGVGSVLSEMLVRCGIGKLILYDYDKVELANMNRLFYTPDQVGLTKVKAAKLTLQKINDQIIIEDFDCNITQTEHYIKMKENIQQGGINNKNVDLVISCVDNYAARMTINKACNELKQTWFESGVSEDALSCHFQIMIPGETACFACIPPLAFVEDNEKDIKREGVCAASLPTTMSMTAGFLAHTALKFLLEFEEIQYYLQYNAKNEFFQNNLFQPNPNCIDNICIENQKFIKENKIDTINDRKQKILNKKKKKQVIQEDFSQWGIEIIEDSSQQLQENVIDQKQLADKNLEDLQAEMQGLF